MQRNIQLSLIIPVYNVEKYIGKCLESVINQTFSNMEIILIDDGSTDQSGLICEKYAKQDHRIRVVHKSNQGLSAARNDGIDLALGEWLAFVDSDDWCSLDYYQRLFDQLQNLDVDVFCGDGAVFQYEKGAVIRRSFTEPFSYSSREDIQKLQEKVLLQGGNRTLTMGVPWDKLYRVDFLRKHGLRYDTKLKAWEDIWFNFQIFDKAEKVAGVVYAGYHYRPVTGSITRGYNPDKIQIGYLLLEKIYKYYDGHRLEGHMKQVLYTRTIEVLLNSFKCSYFHPQYTGTRKEKAKQINSIKKMIYFKEAINSNNNRLLTWKMICFKYVLRFPWLWPLEVLFHVYGMIK